MKPRNVIVTFECRNDIPARKLEGLLHVMLAAGKVRVAGGPLRVVGIVERPKVNVVRNRKCLDPKADGRKGRK